MQGSNPSLPHCRQVLYCLSHQGNLWLRYNSWLSYPVCKMGAMVLNGYKISSRSTCQMVLTELGEIRILSQGRGRRKGPGCRNSSKNAWPGTALVIQCLRIHLPDRGLGFDPCSGKIQHTHTQKKAWPGSRGYLLCKSLHSSNVSKVCIHLKRMDLQEKHWPHSWVDVMWTQTHLWKQVFSGDVSQVFSSPQKSRRGPWTSLVSDLENRIRILSRILKFRY